MWSQFMNLQSPMMKGLMGNYVEQSQNMFQQMQEQMQKQTEQMPRRVRPQETLGPGPRAKQGQYGDERC